MLYYIVLIALVFVLYCISQSMRDSGEGRRLFFFSVCLAVILFQGFRSFSVGIDLGAYLPSYIIIGSQSFRSLLLQHFCYRNFEPGYVLFNWLLYNLGADRRDFLIITAALIQIPIFYTMHKYSEEPLLSVFWYLSFGNFMFTFSGLRQSIAMSLGFFAYSFIRERKALKFAAVILIAAAFHKSILLCLLLYPLYHIKIRREHFPAAAAALVAFILMREKLMLFIGNLFYENFAVVKTGAYTMLIVYLLLSVLSFLSDKEDDDYIGLRNILLLLSCIYMSAPLHPWFTRIGYPLTLYMTLFIPKLTDSLKISPKYIYIGSLALCLCLCFLLKFAGSLKTLPFSFF